MQCYSMPKRPIRCHNYDVTAVCVWLISVWELRRRETKKTFCFWQAFVLKALQYSELYIAK